MSVESFLLSSGYSIPAIGFGTWEPVESQRSAILEATLIALKTGYRHIDTAWIYGSERFVGEAIRKSRVPRREIFITTKVYCDKTRKVVDISWNHMHTNVEKSVDMSLQNLGQGIGYIDLLLIHCAISIMISFDV